MDSRVLKVFVAVALGAFVGALVTLQLNPLVWWLGLGIGGLVGYLAYEPKIVIHAIPIAARNAYKAGGEGLQKIVHIATTILSAFALGCRRVVSRRKELLWYLAAGWTMGFWLLVALNYPFVTVPAKYRALGTWGEWNGPWFLMLFPIFTILPALAALTVSNTELSADTRRWQKFAQQCNPFSVIMLAAWYAVRFTPSAVKFLTHFTTILFRLIHSKERLLCMVDAAIGAVIGHFFGNAITGALLGGLFGALNFEILSKRVLKVVPVRSRS